MCKFLLAFYYNYVSISYLALEIRVMSHSRSLEMAPCDRSYTTSYWSAIVNIALSCTIFELSDVKQLHDLDGSLQVIGNDNIR